MKIIFALILALVGGALFAQPYYTAHQMREAADRGDHRALSSFIDFPAVRDSLKTQGNAFARRRVEQEIGSGPLAELGGAIGGLFSGHVIDAAVTPESLAKLMAGNPDKTPPSPSDGEVRNGSSQTDIHLGYTAWDRFEVTATDDEQQARMVLARQGLAWKLVAVEID